MYEIITRTLLALRTILHATDVGIVAFDENKRPFLTCFIGVNGTMDVQAMKDHIRVVLATLESGRMRPTRREVVPKPPNDPSEAN